MDRSLAKLDYARPPSSRPIPWRRLSVVLALLAIVIGGWACKDAILHRVELLRLQHQCMVYTPAANTVAYEEDPNAAALLISSNPEYRARSLIHNGVPRQTAVAMLDPRCWTSLYWCRHPMHVGSNVGPWPQSVLYLHERVSPAGHQRLIAVTYERWWEDDRPDLVQGYNCFVNVIVPGGGFADPVDASMSPTIGVPEHKHSVPPVVRIYAGQSDPADPRISRFGIKCGARQTCWTAGWTTPIT
jgi:hypothetical protein